MVHPVVLIFVSWETALNKNLAYNAWLLTVWFGVLTWSVGLVTKLLIRLSLGTLPGNNSGQVVHTHVPQFTKQYNLVPVKGWWRSAAGKVTVCLASHWPCVTNSVVYPPTGSMANGRWAPPSKLFRVWPLYLYFYCHCVRRRGWDRWEILRGVTAQQWIADIHWPQCSWCSRAVCRQSTVRLSTARRKAPCYQLTARHNDDDKCLIACLHDPANVQH